MRKKEQPAPKKPTYQRVNPTDLALRMRLSQVGDDLLTRAGFQASKKVKLIDGSPLPSLPVPLWMDTISALWLRNGSKIPWTAFKDAIAAGMQGRMDEVEFFLFTWEAV